MKSKALELHSSLAVDGEFTASNGWIERFKARNGISSRRITGYAQKIPPQLPMLAEMFWGQINSIGTLIMLCETSQSQSYHLRNQWNNWVDVPEALQRKTPGGKRQRVSACITDQATILMDLYTTKNF